MQVNHVHESLSVKSVFDSGAISDKNSGAAHCQYSSYPPARDHASDRKGKGHADPLLYPGR